MLILTHIYLLVAFIGPTELSELVALVDCETSVPTFNKVPCKSDDAHLYSVQLTLIIEGGGTVWVTICSVNSLMKHFLIE